MTYTFDPENTDSLLDVLKDDDIVQILGGDLIKLLDAGKTSKGRKPISVDISLFNEVVERWNSGEITAREAMRILDLKPNTFYRRIKEFNERNDLEMTDNIKEELNEAKKLIHKEAKEARRVIKEDARATKKDIKEIQKMVHSDAKDALHVAEEKKDLLEMEMEIKAEKIGAEICHRDSVEALRAEVEKETAEHKASNN